MIVSCSRWLDNICVDKYMLALICALLRSLGRKQDLLASGGILPCMAKYKLNLYHSCKYWSTDREVTFTIHKKQQVRVIPVLLPAMQSLVAVFMDWLGKVAS